MLLLIIIIYILYITADYADMKNKVYDSFSAIFYCLYL